MTLDLLVEGVVAVLLAVAICYGFILNRKLGALRAEQENLNRLVSGLNQATTRAQESVYELRAVAQTTEEGLKRETAKARALSDELALITEAGNNLAQKIERGLSERRKTESPVRLVEPGAAPASPAPRKGVARLWDLEGKTDDDLRTALRAAR